MKMTRIESARIVEKQKGYCIGILCADCFTTREKCGCKELGRLSWDKRKLQLAEAYIKRHEQKCKKRLIPKYTADVQPDKTGSELKKIVMKPANTDPTPLEIAKMIRDNGYVINCKDFSPNLACGSCTTDFCDHILSKEKARASIKKIDDYISSHEKIEPVCEHLVGDLCGNAFETCDKECLANSEILKPEPVTVKAFEGCHALNGNECMNYMKCGLESCPAYNSEPVIEPIKFQLPKIAFVVFADGIGVRSKNFTIDSDGNLIHSGCLCYDNIDKAVAVWNATYGKEVKK